MDHSYFKDRVSAYHDAGLNLEEQELMRQHIAECAECRAALAELEAFDRMVEERSSLKADDYFEKSAQKIEAALGFGEVEKVTDITPAKRSGLWWKASAVVATAAVLAFIAIHEEEILEPAPQPQGRQEAPLIQNEGVRLPESSRPTPDIAVDDADEMKQERSAGDLQVDMTEPKSKEKRSVVVPPSPQEAPQKATLSDEPVRKDQLQESDLSKAIEVTAEAFHESDEVEKVKLLTASPDHEALGNAEGTTFGERTVLGGGREADTARLAYWQKQLAEVSTVDKKRMDKTTAPSALTGKLADDARKRSYAAAVERADSLPADSVVPATRGLLEAHYMVASLTADTAEYRESILYIRTIAEKSTDPDLSGYARKILVRLGVDQD